MLRIGNPVKLQEYLDFLQELCADFACGDISQDEFKRKYVMYKKVNGL